MAWHCPIILHNSDIELASAISYLTVFSFSTQSLSDTRESQQDLSAPQARRKGLTPPIQPYNSNPLLPPFFLSYLAKEVPKLFRPLGGRLCPSRAQPIGSLVIPMHNPLSCTRPGTVLQIMGCYAQDYTFSVREKSTRESNTDGGGGGGEEPRVGVGMGGELRVGLRSGCHLMGV